MKGYFLIIKIILSLFVGKKKSSIECSKINILDQSNETALHYSCGGGYFGGSVALTKLLLKTDADVHI
ncbi:hypothetical protein CDAR_488641 [Caerostris darwini]|uniref:Uncharacterized protein n=1 Tax=Caerostris darwini TaxID=1538125 RepID=A0AAV4S7U7_9ARAC|nr:hypothetical protein CDAR_488641 [Caerostris darwini]